MFQVVTKRFYHRENNSSAGAVDGDAVNKIENAVGLLVVIVVEAVQIEERKQRNSFGGGAAVGNIIDIRTDIIIEKQNLELKIFLGKIISTQRINIFHHQVPRIKV